MVGILRLIMLVMMAGLLVSVIIAGAYMLGQRIGRGKVKSKLGEIPSDAGIRDLLLEGRMQEAITTYRNFTGVDEFTAQKMVKQIQREMRLSSQVRDEVATLLQSGKKAAAIESYQTATGASLAEALEYVEAQQA